MRTFNLLLQYLFFLASSSSLVHGQTTTSNVCNGVNGLCGFSVNEILYGMVHNAMSSPSHGFTIFSNHENDPIVASLDAGYRGISLDICRCNGQLVFCHGSSLVGCGVGSRNATETFQQIDDWLEANPREVVVFFLQVNNGAGGGAADISLQDVESILSNSFKSKMYQHDNVAWPTLGEMVQDCKQIIFFYTSGPNGNPPNGNPNGIHFFFDYASQTSFSHRSVESLQGAPCEAIGTQQDFYLFNDFILDNGIAPSKAAAQTINTGTFVEPILEQCQSVFDHPVNFVSVDFWSHGDLSDFIPTYNAGLVVKDGGGGGGGGGGDSTKAQVTVSTDACRPVTVTPTSAPTLSPPSAPSNPTPDSSANRDIGTRLLILSLTVSVILLA
ncbi:unnamed protein product [Cylindrotheca closterium]|uniref:PLC-like phosphodiesterase n=1 Tax=Cylindrotheca closterium TaxID=2856 RepID=A0AAD2FMR1_9STRA|nr:unnamed protein product [Cylindrotheca closterium]